MSYSPALNLVLDLKLYTFCTDITSIKINSCCLSHTISTGFACYLLQNTKYKKMQISKMVRDIYIFFNLAVCRNVVSILFFAVHIHTFSPHHSHVVECFLTSVSSLLLSGPCRGFLLLCGHTCFMILLQTYFIFFVTI